MDGNYSRAALLKFIEMLREKGLVNAHTADGYRAACAKILAELPPQDEADVRKIDVESAIRRFNNKHPGKLSPSSLAEYQRRISTVIGQFVRYVENPQGFKPIGRASGKKPERPIASRDGKGGRATAPASGAKVEVPPTMPSLSMRFPLRADFLAELILPRDLKTEEARRLSAFIVTLATDYKPSS